MEKCVKYDKDFFKEERLQLDEAHKSVDVAKKPRN